MKNLILLPLLFVILFSSCKSEESIEEYTPSSFLNELYVNSIVEHPEKWKLEYVENTDSFCLRPINSDVMNIAITINNNSVRLVYWHPFSSFETSFNQIEEDCIYEAFELQIKNTDTKKHVINTAKIYSDQIERKLSIPLDGIIGQHQIEPLMSQLE